MAGDEQILRRVENALRSHDLLGVRVSVSYGIAVLWGRMTEPRDAVHAERIARSVPGVSRVRNALEARTTMLEATDDHIFAAARHALSWSLRGESGRIRCSVDQGRITLEGQVSSDSLRAAAEHAVHHVGGRYFLVNRIQVMAAA